MVETLALPDCGTAKGSRFGGGKHMSEPVLRCVSQGLVDAGVTVGGFRVEVGHQRPFSRLPPHAHVNANVLFVLSGSFVQRVEGVDHPADSGTVVEKPAGARHEDWFHDRPAQILYVEVFGPRLEQVQRELGLLSDGRSFRAPGARRLVHRLAGTVRRTPIEPLLIEALAMELLVSLAADRSTTTDRNEQRLAGVIDQLEAQIADPPDLGALSVTAEIEEIQLLKLFGACFSETPTEYVRRRRLEEAARLLAATEEPIADIALHLGFSDQAHLTRGFRAAFGLPPGRYRRRLHS